MENFQEPPSQAVQIGSVEIVSSQFTREHTSFCNAPLQITRSLFKSCSQTLQGTIAFSRCWVAAKTVRALSAMELQWESQSTQVRRQSYVCKDQIVRRWARERTTTWRTSLAPAKCHACHLPYFTMRGTRIRSYRFSCGNAETRGQQKTSLGG